MMINANYIDTYTAINPNSDGFTAPYPDPIMRIDFIFVNSYSNLVVDDSYLFGEQPISQDFYCSDHLGIMTIFSNPTYVGIEEELTVPKSFSLSQNCPNPFNPTTMIEYNIPLKPPSKGGNNVVHLKIYDILGNEVATLVNEEQPPGEYSVKFNVETLHATSLPNGIYFYRLSQGNNTIIKKMLLIK